MDYREPWSLARVALALLQVIAAAGGGGGGMEGHPPGHAPLVAVDAEDERGPGGGLAGHGLVGGRARAGGGAR